MSFDGTQTEVIKPAVLKVPLPPSPNANPLSHQPLVLGSDCKRIDAHASEDQYRALNPTIKAEENTDVISFRWCAFRIWDLKGSLHK